MEDENEPNKSLIPPMPPNLFISLLALRQVIRIKSPAMEIKSNGNGSKRVRIMPTPMKINSHFSR